jgi:hypothetical protein
MTKPNAALRELQSKPKQPAPQPDPEPAPSVEKKKSRNEPTAPPETSPNIHLCRPVGQVPDLPSPPQSGNPEDHEG